MFKTEFPPYLSLSERTWHYALRIVCALILVFLLLPILVIVPLSFNQSSMLLYPIDSFSLRWYQTLFHSDEWARATANSFIVAPAATLLATILGTLAAAGLHRAAKAEAYCNAAKQNFQIYADGGRISKMNAQGERELLTDEEIEAKRASTRREMEEACKKS